MGFDRLRLRPALLSVGAAIAAAASAGTAQAETPKFEVYGFAMADYIQDFKRVDPAWDDTLRPSKIPTQEGVFGSDGQSLISPKQSRFGVQAWQPIAGNDFHVKFEFDLYGTGVDAGQTTFRLRHFYGEWGPILAGQTNTVFMDIDTFPNVVDYWGPNGMVFVRTPQVRYTYKKGGHEIAVAIEKPSNDIDVGLIRQIDPNLGANIQGDEKIPDFTAHYKYGSKWGHFQLAGILRRVGYDTKDTVDNKPKGSKLGWGIQGSSNINVLKTDVIHLSAVYGQGIATYMNDGGVDLAANGQPIGPAQPGLPAPGPPTAKAVPLFGMMAYYDHAWGHGLTSSIGYSRVQVDNTTLQEPSAFKIGEYASANLLWSPEKHILMGVEGLYGRREDNNGFSGHDTRMQVSFKYSFTSLDFFK
jgi:hypothetical protein